MSSEQGIQASEFKGWSTSFGDLISAPDDLRSVTGTFALGPHPAAQLALLVRRERQRPFGGTQSSSYLAGSDSNPRTGSPWLAF